MDISNGPRITTIEGVAEAIYGMRDDIRALRGAMYPRNEAEAELRSLSQRVGNIEKSPNSVRDWLGFVVAAVVAIFTIGGCLFTGLLGVIGIGVSIWLATRP